MISVVLCTRDRATQLESCLRHFCDARPLCDFAWQLVVVDNGSRDGTRPVVERFAAELPIDYVYEARRGLSHARNRGIAQARHPVIAFTDDDCLVDAEWPRAIVAYFEQHPDVSVIAGRVELADAGDAPVSIRTHDRMEIVATAGQILSLAGGCNMAFRREVFETAGWFDPAFGKGRAIASGDDLDMLYRAVKRGARMAYVPHIVVRHAHGRREPAALAQLAREYVRGRGAFYLKHIGDGAIARMAWWEARALLRPAATRAGAMPAHAALTELAAGATLQCLNALRTFGARTPASVRSQEAA
jgi:glycosyltransferase involved in cell wall biosynthesis